MKLSASVCLAVLCIAGMACVSKQTISVKVRESNELPRGKKISYEGGTGESREQAVVIIGAKDIKEGVTAEYDFISENHGKKDKGWRIKGQTQVREDNKVYDMIEMEIIESGTSHYYYFDISNCAWKP